MIETDQQIPTLGRLTRRTIATCVGAVENRAELFAVEFAEENERLIKLILFGVGGFVLAMMTVVLVTGTIIFMVPDRGRIWAALGFAVLYLAGAIVVALAVKRLLKQTPFAESLNQIKKDSELLDAFK